MTKQTRKPIPVRVAFASNPVDVLPMYRCPYCGAEWIPRKNQPKVCPSCHRKLWTQNVSKKRKVSKKGGK